jgi:DNA helicase HerA-like ATPase
MLGEQENASQYIDFLVSRIRTFLSDVRMKSVVGDGGVVTLEGWLNEYIGSESNPRCITIIDLSLVPSEVIHVVTAVIARVVFDALQRYLKLNKVVLPTVLVMEEAHTFVKRYKEDAENQDAASVCCQVFERIAREGRKFGLGLVLSSQRPSELSPTVLSQCNTFLLHRISNDRDQELVHRLVPDNLKGLLRELPSLSSQNAVLLGWASELPLLVKMSDLPKSQQPRSDDPDFWNVWTRKDDSGKPVVRKADWKEIAADWQGSKTSDSGEK